MMSDYLAFLPPALKTLHVSFISIRSFFRPAKRLATLVQPWEPTLESLEFGEGV